MEHFSIIVCVYVWYVCERENSVIGLKLKQLFDIMRHSSNFSLNHFFISNKVDLLCRCHSSVVQNPCPVRNKLSARAVSRLTYLARIFIGFVVEFC